MVTAPGAAAAGVAADLLLGEPPLEPHPVALFGRAMRRVERVLYHDSRLAGVAHAAAGVALGAMAGELVGSTAFAAYLVSAGRGLADAALGVAAELDRGDLAAARALLPALVGRDPTGLDEQELARAVVESVAENTVDAVIAPAFWSALGGARAAGAYRAVNTLDSMVGHKTDRYASYGWASARLDDLAAFAPARLTALLVAAVRPAAAADVLRSVARDAGAHPSPNAGVAEAAFAAALGLRLGGVNAYASGVEVRPALGHGRPPARDDIRRAVALSRDVTLAAVAALSAFALVRRARRR